MKQRRKLILLGSLCIFLCIAMAGVALLAWRGDWRYRLWNRIRSYPAPALTQQMPDGECSEMSLADFLNDPRVTVTSDLLLINSTSPIPEWFTPDLIEKEDILMNDTVLTAFWQMRDAVQSATGEKLFVRSAWRSAEEQEQEWINSGEDIAARPGYSEHETGMSLDICVAGYGGMAFLKSVAGRYVNDHCGDYGFIIRYPDGKTHETGKGYEPWHIRYVGAPHAAVIMNGNLTLEEYLELLTPETWFASSGYRILRTRAETISVPSGFTSCTASQDNLGYWILTFPIA